VRIWENRYNRDVQRLNLALRMIAHKARTNMICEWTGLPYERVRKLCRTYAPTHSNGGKDRNRGPSPHLIGRFLGSARGRLEAAALVSVCLALDVVPAKPVANARREVPGVVRGERLCKAFEMYSTLVPDSTVTIEQVALLVLAVAEGVEVGVGHCDTCRAVILHDPYGIGQWHCTHCSADIIEERKKATAS